MYGLLNAPIIGAVVGAIIGFTPPIHRAFFSQPKKGGYFTAWLTESMANVGELFPALQPVIFGAKLSISVT
jgi:auxin efflux carrier family protein